MPGSGCKDNPVLLMLVLPLLIFVSLVEVEGGVDEDFPAWSANNTCSSLFFFLKNDAFAEAVALLDSSSSTVEEAVAYKVGAMEEKNRTLSFELVAINLTLLLNIVLGIDLSLCW